MRHLVLFRFMPECLGAESTFEVFLSYRLSSQLLGIENSSLCRFISHDPPLTFWDIDQIGSHIGFAGWHSCFNVLQYEETHARLPCVSIAIQLLSASSVT